MRALIIGQAWSREVGRGEEDEDVKEGGTRNNQTAQGIRLTCGAGGNEEESGDGREEEGKTAWEDLEEEGR